MWLRFKVGTHPARLLYVCRKRNKPVVGESFDVVDKNEAGSKPFRVRCTEIKMHTGAGEMFFVEMV